MTSDSPQIPYFNGEAGDVIGDLSIPHFLGHKLQVIFLLYRKIAAKPNEKYKSIHAFMIMIKSKI
jgi:hypothetical protein